MGKSPPVVIPAELLDFYEELLRFQSEIGALLDKPQWQIDEAQIKEHQLKGKPWFAIISPQIDPLIFAKIWRQTAEYLAYMRPPIKEEIDRILIAERGIDFSNLAGKAVQQDEAFMTEEAVKWGLNPGLFFLVAEHAVRPFIRNAAAALVPFINQEAWLKDICPVCGQKASISKLRHEDGKRVMYCSHCATEWLHRHLVCPQCGNDDHQTIRFFAIEGYDAHQIYICDKCKGYIKTYDEKKGGPLEDLEIEDIKTIYLDMLAEREGYANTSVNKKLLH